MEEISHACDSFSLETGIFSSWTAFHFNVKPILLSLLGLNIDVDAWMENSFSFKIWKFLKLTA